MFFPLSNLPTPRHYATSGVLLCTARALYLVELRHLVTRLASEDLNSIHPVILLFYHNVTICGMIDVITLRVKIVLFASRPAWTESKIMSKKQPELKVISTGSWMTDERSLKICDMCTHYEATQYAWLCKRDRRQFKIMDSPYHTTCSKFKAVD